MHRTLDYPGLRILNVFFQDPYREVHLFKANLDKTSFRLWKTSLFLLKNERHLRQFASQYPDSSLTLYGSCATGTDAPGSDLDLLLITRHDQDPSPSQLDELSRRTHRTAQLLK